MASVTSINRSSALAYDLHARLKLRSLLHTRNMFSKFPANHTLSKVIINLKEHRIFLLREIMGQSVGGTSSRLLPGWGALKPVLELHLLPVLANLIDNHRKFNYKEALCAAYRRKKLRFPDASDESPVDTDVILTYVTETIHKVLPPELIGRNSRGLQRLARSMVRGYLPLTVKHLMHYISGSLDCGWLGFVPSTLLKQHMAAKLSLWVAAEFVPGIMRAVLFGTQTASGKSHPIYFTKPTWQSRSRRALDHLIETGCLQKLPKEDFPNDTLEPGVLKFLPKPNGLRPIVVRRLKNEELSNRMKKAKLLMRKINRPVIRINNEWSAFRTTVLSAREAGEEGQIYFVRTDVQSAFVTVRHDKMLQVLADHMATLPSQVQVEQYVNSWLQRKIQGVSNSQSSQNSQNSSNSNSQGSQSARPIPRLVTVSRDAAYKTLRQEIEQQVVRHGTRRYIMKVGVAQGSPLSNNLSNMVFDDLCRTQLSHFNTPDGRSVLWRVADDFLLLTLCEDIAKKFKEVISAGFPDYGWQMSVAKSVDNIGVSDKVTRVSYNGSVFDLVTLEAMADLSQYTADNVFFSMSFRQLAPTSEDMFRGQLLVSGSLKINKLYLDMRTVSREKILQQISASGKLQAIRLRALTRYLLGADAKRDSSSLFIANCIWKASGRLCQRILKQLNLSANVGDTSIPSANEIKWLLNMAVLKRSSGYLGKARDMIKRNILKLESQINPELMKQCYHAFNSTREWDAKDH